MTVICDAVKWTWLYVDVVMCVSNFNEAIKLKFMICKKLPESYSRMRISIPKQLPEQTHFGWGTATQNGMGFTKIDVKQL